jgi:hypothetical protein
MANTAEAIVARIDRRIDQLRDTLRLCEKEAGRAIVEDDFMSWGFAWDMHPDLKYEEKGLFLARSIAHEFEAINA